MKLIVQIPAFNESESLPQTLADLPRNLEGLDRVEWLVVDDGSSDATCEVARSCGADHVVRLPKHVGLARAFSIGIEECLKLGADIIVNTDADNQYVASEIDRLIRPILEGRADFVIGARALGETAKSAPLKRYLYFIGSYVVCWASGQTIRDPRSGFRAFSRNAAGRLRIHGHYTYTMETIIQASRQNIRIEEIPIRTNSPVRPSRLIKNVPTDLWYSACSIASARMRF